VEASGVDARAIALIERCARSSARPWFVATRDLAAVPFARWCASGLVDEPVDERDLRFDAADAFRLVASAGFGDAADDVAALLLRGTDGWPAAFLAALAEAATAFDRPSLAPDRVRLSGALRRAGVVRGRTPVVAAHEPLRGPSRFGARRARPGCP
jgi:hypothetical protein